MRVAVVHGYFLHDSGSGIYTRELAQEFVRQGHEVLLICQERNPDRYGFIDTAYKLDESNRILSRMFTRPRTYAGSCTMVRPNLGGRLLTYVSGPFKGFEAKAFQEAPGDWLLAYIEANRRALKTVFNEWPPAFVQANHLVMQPYVAMKALEGSAPFVITVHGSELNFTIRHDDRMVAYALEAAAGCEAMLTLSLTSREEVIALGDEHGVDLRSRTHELPPGLDTEVFRVRGERKRLLTSFWPEADPEDDYAVFAGRLLWTKGLQYTVAAMPLVLRERPGFRLLVAGDGPMRPAIDLLIDALAGGNGDAVTALLERESQLRPAPDYGPVLPPLAIGGKPDGEISREEYLRAAVGLRDRIHFVGHLDHARLAELFSVADVSLAPSVFPEAFGLVSIEAMACGALPIATYQSGLMTPIDSIAGSLSEPQLKELAPGISLTPRLAQGITALLARYPTRDAAFRERLHEIARAGFSWSHVVNRMLEFA